MSTPNPTMIDALSPMDLVISAEHAEGAVCKDPHRCVIAQAIFAKFGNRVEDWGVGPTITKIKFRGNPMWIRWVTPRSLANGLSNFDRKGVWDIPPGTYWFEKPKGGDRLGGRPNRWDVQPNGRGTPGMKRMAPSRRLNGPAPEVPA